MKKLFDKVGKKREKEGSLVGKVVMVGQYSVKVEALIGEGGFATIYRCTDVKSGLAFALKHMRLAADTDAIKEVQQEAKTMARLKGHPNILKLHAVAFAGPPGAETDGFMLLDFCPVTLLEVMQRSNFVLDDFLVYEVFQDVAWAVAHMHKCTPPLAHRDLKAENVLKNSEGRWVICDFGSSTARAQVYDTPAEIAAEEDNIRRTTTPAYRAPEMWDLYSRQRIDTAVDVWALGVLLYVLAFGKLPFQGDSKLSILYGKYDMPAGRPPAMRALIQDMLQINPADRPDIFQVISKLDLLRTALCSEGSGELLPPPPPPPAVVLHPQPLQQQQQQQLQQQPAAYLQPSRPVDAPPAGPQYHPPHPHLHAQQQQQQQSLHPYPHHPHASGYPQGQQPAPPPPPYHMQHQHPHPHPHPHPQQSPGPQPHVPHLQLGGSGGSGGVVAAGAGAPPPYPGPQPSPRPGPPGAALPQQQHAVMNGGQGVPSRGTAPPSQQQTPLPAPYGHSQQPQLQQQQQLYPQVGPARSGPPPPPHAYPPPPQQGQQGPQAQLQGSGGSFRGVPRPAGAMVGNAGAGAGEAAAALMHQQQHPPSRTTSNNSMFVPSWPAAGTAAAASGSPSQQQPAPPPQLPNLLDDDPYPQPAPSPPAANAASAGAGSAAAVAAAPYVGLDGGRREPSGPLSACVPGPSYEGSRYPSQQQQQFVKRTSSQDTSTLSTLLGSSAPTAAAAGGGGGCGTSLVGFGDDEADWGEQPAFNAAAAASASAPAPAPPPSANASRSNLTLQQAAPPQQQQQQQQRQQDDKQPSLMSMEELPRPAALPATCNGPVNNGSSSSSSSVAAAPAAPHSAANLARNSSSNANACTSQAVPAAAQAPSATPAVSAVTAPAPPPLPSSSAVAATSAAAPAVAASSYTGAAATPSEAREAPSSSGAAAGGLDAVVASNVVESSCTAEGEDLRAQLARLSTVNTQLEGRVRQLEDLTATQASLLQRLAAQVQALQQQQQQGQQLPPPQAQSRQHSQKQLLPQEHEPLMPPQQQPQSQQLQASQGQAGSRPLGFSDAPAWPEEPPFPPAAAGDSSGTLPAAALSPPLSVAPDAAGGSGSSGEAAVAVGDETGAAAEDGEGNDGERASGPHSRSPGGAAAAAFATEPWVASGLSERSSSSTAIYPAIRYEDLA